MKLEPLYKMTKSGKTQFWQIEVIGNKYRTISGQTDGKKVTSEWTIATGKNIGKSNGTSDEEQAIVEARAKWTKKSETGYYADVNNIGIKQYFEPMLAKDFDDYKDNLEFPLFSQPKLDGIRCIVTKDGMFTRNGKEIISAPHILNELRYVFDSIPDLILDGELYSHEYKDDFNKIVSLVKKTKPTSNDLVESSEKIEYWIYDIPSVDKNFHTRSWILSDIFNDYDLKHSIFVPTHICNNVHDIERYYSEYINDGYEGQMIRLDKKYENKRSKYLLKHKDFVDSEYTILDIIEGDGNRTGCVGYMCFETNDGKSFKSNVKGTMDELSEMLSNKDKLIGKTATIKYFNLTPDGVPRFPVVIKINREEYE